MLVDYPEGTTPLTPEEKLDLIPDHITTRAELDRWEYENILKADNWVFRTTVKDILTESFVRRLHRKMFNDTWKWAGEYRQTEKNLGVEVWKIQPSVVDACSDAQYLIATGDPMGPDEVAIRLHHRLVSVHPFPNGNGRHGRLMADIVVMKVLGQPRFSWGHRGLGQSGGTRSKYLSALKIADSGHGFASLMAFARS
jgi:Fic-DOC domain mobile mystery protein B